MEEFTMQQGGFDLTAEPTCQCVVAVKIKDGGQICQLCGLSAYENKYVFSHTPEGVALMDHNSNPDGGSADDIASIERSILKAGEPPILTGPIPTYVDPADPPKRARKQKTVKAVNPFLEAMQFAQLAQRPKGDPSMTHCGIRYGGVVAFDRTIAAGAPVPHNDLNCYPDTALLTMALMRCENQYRIIQYDTTLYIESAGHSSHIPIVSAESIVSAVPDPMIAPLGDAFRDSLRVTGKLIKETGAELMNMAVQLNPYTTIASDGRVILEAYHGFEFPPNAMLVPKRFVDAIKKTKRVIVGFGFSSSTFTVWFTDGWWIRTNLYNDKFSMNLLDVLNSIPTTNTVPIPAPFFDAAEYVARFGSNGMVYCFNGRISSHGPYDQQGATTFAMEGFTQGRAYLIDGLKAIRPHAQSIASDHERLTLFFGSNVRGAIMHEAVKPVISTPVKRVYAAPATCYDCGAPWDTVLNKCSICPNDIPF